MLLPVLPMYIILQTLLLLLAGSPAAPLLATEAHLREAGTSAIFLRSPFAHGYRHGYEEGYHLGNIDINMGRHPRTKLSQFHDLSLGYAPEFGSKKSFTAGFHEGLKAGYNDGFVGRKFRAIENLRMISLSLDRNPSPSDPGNAFFDRGVSTGYNLGLESHLPEQLDPGSSACTGFQPARSEEAAEGSFCDGYRRGYTLGQADEIVLHADGGLSARK